ncbi:putative porin [Paludibacter sp. 221]|uniref:putative porin n=1 Tax=Paludibacter sp. 221 TaxID=2302939 RepID=UPI0013D7352D|nr:putative porin [Paludibacter sp. 221]
MKKTLLLFFSFLLVSIAAHAVGKNRYVKTWNIVSPIAVADTIPVDTAHVNFQDANPIDRFSIANSYNGNMGSPIQSKLYFSRPASSRFVFADAYYPYVVRPENVTYYNTKTPYSNLEYLGGMFANFRDEDNVKLLFTANANKRLNFGGKLDFTRAIGEYESQATKRLSGNLFGSYDGDRYSASGAIIINSLNNYENGGITNPDDIHKPELNDAKNIPVRINGYSAYRYNAFVYNHNYSLGFTRDIEVSEDSVRTEFVPVTRFTHVLKLSDERKRYLEQSPDTSFYLNTYYSSTLTQDTAALQTISNTFAVSIEEEFNKWMQFGLSAYIQNDMERYTLTVDSGVVQHANRNRTKIGGVLSKQRGARFRYNINAEFDILGPQIGDFNIEGTLGGFFRLWNDSIALIAKGFMRNESPSFFLEQYSSNHFRWNNNFDHIYRTQVGGTFSIPTRAFNLNVSLENLNGYIYFDKDAMPKQFGGHIQLLSANLKQNFRLGKIHLENNVVYQVSSNPDLLPLPALTLYHNLYYLDQWFDVLNVQFGADVRYHTAYYAPDYMPATGQFTLQDKMKIGNYPVMNAYLNFHLKQVRFFLKYYHFNKLFMKGPYFSMPNYPINPAVFRIGISWNFYN